MLDRGPANDFHALGIGRSDLGGFYWRDIGAETDSLMQLKKGPRSSPANEPRQRKV